MNFIFISLSEAVCSKIQPQYSHANLFKLAHPNFKQSCAEPLAGAGQTT